MLPWENNCIFFTLKFRCKNMGLVTEDTCCLFCNTAERHSLHAAVMQEHFLTKLVAALATLIALKSIWHAKLWTQLCCSASCCLTVYIFTTLSRGKKCHEHVTLINMCVSWSDMRMCILLQLRITCSYSNGSKSEHLGPVLGLTRY